jgi:hypothetical protein
MAIDCKSSHPVCDGQPGKNVNSVLWRLSEAVASRAGDWRDRDVLIEIFIADFWQPAFGRFPSVLKTMGQRMIMGAPVGV